MVLPSTTDIVTVAVVVFLTIYNVLSGNKKDKRDEIIAENNAMQILRTTVNTYRDEVDKLKSEVHENAKQLEKMKGVIEEKDKQLLMFERVFQNRSPEMDKFVKDLSEEARQNAVHRRNSEELFDQMIKTLKGIQEILKSNGFHQNEKV